MLQGSPSFIHVGAGESHHQRDFECEGFCGSNDASGDDVAAHDAAEDVDENALDIGVFKNDGKGGLDLFFVGPTADIQEICGLASVEFDDVHRGHGQTGTVDEAADVAVEFDVREAGFLGSNFHVLFL